MENELDGSESAVLPEVRLILIGERWAGKSVSGNTILGKERFECGRTRTTQTEVRHAKAQGRRLLVVDAPGWSRSLSLTEIPEGDKRRFKLNASRCPPGPHAFLLVVPVDSAFSVKNRRTVEEHMKLLGERVWRHTVVLFTCGDFLGEKTIEQHIESEGESLRWLTERCWNRYHVFDNKDRGDGGQVRRLLQMVDEVARHNGGRCYQVDEQTLSAIEEKQREVAKRAEVRKRRSEEQRSQMRTLVPEMKTLPELRVVLLGSRSVGKTSLGNSVLGFKEHEDGKRTARSAARRGFVGTTEITVVDTPGWWKGFSVLDTPEATREEVMRSPFLCLPGPHVFLLAIDADASFNAKHLDAVTSHVELLGEGVWQRTVVVFTRGDWLGSHTAEEYIEGEGEALRSLVDRCGNRYHVIDNKSADDGTQITELLEKIAETVAGDGQDYFVPDDKVFLTMEVRRSSVVEAAHVRKSQVVAKRKILRDDSQELPELTMVMLGQKTFGKSATGNNLLRREAFPTFENESSKMETGIVSGRLVTVIDTPGWRNYPSYCSKERDREIVRGLSLSPSGVHAVLLVVPLDLSFGEAQRAALEERLNLFDAAIWKHAVVLFTYGDNLAEETVEEHIEREHSALRWLIDKCENKYHVMNNTKKMDPGQVIELFEKIEEIVAGNDGRLFRPEMDDVYLRIEENFGKRQLKLVLKQRLGEEYKRRELEMMAGFRETLLQLQADVKGRKTSTRSMPLTKGIAFRKKDEKEKEKEDILSLKIKKEIEKLDKDIEVKSSTLLQSSMDIILPDMKAERPGSSVAGSLPRGEEPKRPYDDVLGWLSTLQIGKNVDNQMTLNFSQTSGYRSLMSYDDLDSEVEEY
ncbi:GTPase IMAP family member 8-like isoform X2 [Pseudoliparis swirei]|uniref:GTPase IMAP family member 8-like isoform X2 n=1 Tax=Pseudoliparis swirei TaxID=2059687 RepID=UPI0024BE80B9|nr:GTPase IMAP family member 8-like isoform X2 [Pseudoliparis swirei]